MTTKRRSPAEAGGAESLRDPESSHDLEPSHDLQIVRAELRRMGYLDQRFGRFLLQDALKPQRPVRAVLELTAKVAIAAGFLLALVLTFALASANGNLAATPFDLFPLILHLLPPTVSLVGLVFLLVSGAMALLLQVSHIRRIEVVSFGAALLVGLGLAVFCLWRILALWTTSSHLAAVLGLLGAAAVVFLVVKVLENGLLALAIRLTDQAPRRRFLSRTWLAGVLLLVVTAVSVPALLAVRGKPQQALPHLPEVAGDRVLLLGVDGVLPLEADYLLKMGGLPALTKLMGDGGRWLSYQRPQVVPATFWTTLATGLGELDHGVSAVDSFRPLGVTTPLARNGPLRAYWQRIAVPLGLAENLPVLAAERRAPTLWELAARGGQPVVVMNWWATFPAASLPGLVVSHGAYQLIEEGANGAVASATDSDLVEAVEKVAATTERKGQGSTVASLLEASMGEESAAQLLERVILPDRFYLQALELGLHTSPRLAAAYFAGPDLAADGWPGGALAFSDLLRRQLADVDALVSAVGSQFQTIIVVLDPARRGADQGRALLWRQDGCSNAADREGELRALSSAVARALGLPQSRELPPPPDVCTWAPPPDTVPSYGRRNDDLHSLRGDEEYLKSLRSLGYL